MFSKAHSFYVFVLVLLGKQITHLSIAVFFCLFMSSLLSALKWFSKHISGSSYSIFCHIYLHLCIIYSAIHLCLPKAELFF